MGQRQIVNVEAPTIPAASTSGFSVAVALTTSSGDRHLRGGKLVVNVVHSTTDTALHIQFRSCWTDAVGASNCVPIAQFLNSNDEAYGNSALVPNPNVMMKIGQNATQIAVENTAGRIQQIVLLAVSTASALSAQVAVWQVD